MSKKVLSPDTIAPSSSPLSPGIQVGNLVFISGQVALNNERKIVGVNDIREQTRYIMEKISRILQSAGLTLADIVSTTIYLVNREDFKAMNETYAQFFTRESPARATVAAQLMVEGLLVEISAIAMRT